MVVLKLKLSSEKPKKVYALNGRSYLLKPGSNTLNLEYNEYVSLAKALGITPVQPDSVKKEEPEKEGQSSEKLAEEAQEESSCCCDGDSCSFGGSDTVENHDTKPTEESNSAQPCESSTSDDEVDTPESGAENKQGGTDESTQDDTDSETDSEESESDDNLESWSWNKLRAEYKRVSGKACKLKKEAVIQFLRENRDVK